MTTVERVPITDAEWEAAGVRSLAGRVRWYELHAPERASDYVRGLTDSPRAGALQVGLPLEDRASQEGTLG